MIDDLQTAYRQAQAGQPIQLPPKTTSYRDWAQRLTDLAQSSAIKEEASFWLRLAGDEFPATPAALHVSHRAPETMYTEGGVQRVSTRLNHEETQTLLHVAPGIYGAEVNDILLTALARAFQRWTGSPTLWLELEGHGREDILDAINLSRTVGWFTSLYPVRLDLPPDTESDRMVRAIKAQLRRIPRRGLSYGLIRYLCTDLTLRERLKDLPPARVSFNYLGQIHQIIDDDLIVFPAPESIGPTRSPDAPRSHLLDIEAVIIQGELRIEWTYNPQAHPQRTVEHFAGFFLEELRALIAQRDSSASTGAARADRVATGRHQVERDLVLTPWADQASLPRRRDNGTGDSLDAYPLSPMQQGMLFHTLLAPASGMYIEQITCDILGALDVSVFERAWARALERHTMLRSSLLWKHSDRMLQVVHREATLPLALLDWRALPPVAQHRRFNALLAAERSQGFDLATAPLMRLTLARVADDIYRLVFTYHHAVLDGWSVALLFKEIFSLYAAITTNDDLALPTVRPYGDYISWLGAQDLGAAETFWRTALAGCAAMPALSLPALQRESLSAADTSQPVVPAERETRLSTQTTTALRSLARQQGLTLNTIVQGAWALLLSRYAQQDEVMFGVTVAGRPPDLTGIERMIGLFINTLPLRVRVEPQSRIVEWLQRLQHQASEARQYDYTPLVQIQRWSGRSRSAPLFETILVFENYPIDTMLRERVGGVLLQNLHAIEQINYPLALVVVPGPQVQFKAVYDVARFAPDAMERLLDHLCLLLERMASDPGQRLAALSLPAVSQREGLAEAAREPVQMGGQAFIPAQRPLERYLARQWQELLKIERVGIHDDFFELGGNSLLGAALINRLYDAVHEDVALAAIFEAPTIAQLAHYLEAHHPDGVTRLLGTPLRVSSDGKAVAVQAIREAPPEAAALPPALVAIQPSGTRPPLFCVHPAGGVVFPYYTLASYLGKDQPLYGLQDPALYQQRSMFRSIEGMAAHYVRALKAAQPNGPYFLLGWSVGGLIAYEMAQQLTRSGQVVAEVIMLDTLAPAHSKPSASQQDHHPRLQRIGQWVRELPTVLMESGSSAQPILTHVRSGLFLLTASARRKRTERLSSDQRLTLLDRLRWAGIDSWRARLLSDVEVATAVSQDTGLWLLEMPAVRRILELIGEHKRLAHHYVAEGYSGRITFFHAAPGEQHADQTPDPVRGWRRLVAGAVETHTLRANHVALLTRPHVETLAHELSICLERSRASRAAGANRQVDWPETAAADASGCLAPSHISVESELNNRS